MSAYSRLLSNIDDYIRKYYYQRMWKGVLLFLGLGLAIFLVAVYLESMGRFDGGVRAAIFYSGLVAMVALLGYFIVWPLAQILRIGKVISRAEAARQIGMLFPDICDKLINTLELGSNLGHEAEASALLKAAVDQRSIKLNSADFKSGISGRKLKRLAYFVIPVVTLFVGITSFMPSLISEAAIRIVNYDMEFEEPAPFIFGTDQDVYVVVKGEDLTVETFLDGDGLPARVQLLSDIGKYEMNKKSASEFKYTFHHVDRDFQFRFMGRGFESKVFSVIVKSPPILEQMELYADYPAHVGLKDEKIKDVSSLSIPEGTVLSWKLRASKAKDMKMVFSDTVMTRSNVTGRQVAFTKQLLASDKARIVANGSEIDRKLEEEYQIEVVKDMVPRIDVEQFEDSLARLSMFHSGSAMDDYGITRVVVKATVKSESGEKEVLNESLQMSGIGSDRRFNHLMDVKKFNLQPGEQLSWRYVCFDNDKVNGAKSASSQTFVYKAPTRKELLDKQHENNQATKLSMQDAIRKAQEFDEKVKDFKESLYKSKDDTWKKRQAIEDLRDDRNSLEDMLNRMEEQFDSGTEEWEMFDQESEEILEKKEMLDSLMNSIMDDELKDLLDEFYEKLEEMSNEEMLDQMEDVEMKSDELDKELEQALEMFKRFEVEQELENIRDALSELADEQNKEAEETEEKDSDLNQQEKDQEEIEKALEDIMDRMDELKEKDKELERPMNVPSKEELDKGVKKDTQEAKDQMQNNKNKKASDSQKKAGQKMQEMSEQLDGMMSSMMMQQKKEDADALRQLLENLVSLSFTQEMLKEDFRGMSLNDSRYKERVRIQKDLVADSKMVEDSLYALSKRVPQIATTVNSEISGINDALVRILEDVGEGKMGEVGASQQYVMTGYNNLALILSDALQQMQSQMSSMMPGSGSCSNPGGNGSPSPSGMSMQQMKEMLKKQLEQMEKGKDGDKGDQDGGKKPGGEQQGGMGGNKPGASGKAGLSAKEMAKMAAEQAAMRKALEALRQKLGKDGKKAKEGLDGLMKELEESERDLLNKKFDHGVIERQRDILTRLLESEKALMQRGMDDKRESKDGNDKESGNHLRYEQYKKAREEEIELLRTLPADLRKYYKSKAGEYLNQSR